MPELIHTNQVPVLRYRHVHPNGGAFSCTPALFETQMAYLAHSGFTVLSADEFAQSLLGASTPRRSVFITFEGGYLDNYVFAFPILQKYKLKASVFLSTSLIRDGEERANLNGSEMLPYCPPHDECKQRINQGHPESVMMNWDEIRLMKQDGLIEFHSFAHTQTRWYQQLNEEGKNLAMSKELEQSKAILQAELGDVSSHLCWPHGYFDDDYLALAMTQGFEYFYTEQEWCFDTLSNPRQHICRIVVDNKGRQAFAARLWLARHPRVGKMYHSLFLKNLKK